MSADQNYNFWTRYSNLCLKSRVYPLKSILKHLKGTELSCPIERIRREHWPFLLTALSTDRSLTKVHLHSDHPPGVDEKELGKKQTRSNWCFPVSYGRTAKNVGDICKCVAQLLINSKALKSLKFQNFCFHKDDVLYLTETVKDSSLEHFSLSACEIPDDCFETLCQSLQSSSVVWVDFSSSGIDMQRMTSVCNLVKAHGLRSSTEMFPHTLRYQLPVLDAIKGLRRVSLNNNEIGDEGVQMLMDIISEDMWVKALDLQKCCIGDKGAQSILRVARSNMALQVVDIRLNDINEALVTRISLQMSLNNANKELKYKLGNLWKPPIVPQKILKRKACVKTKQHLSPTSKVSKRNHKSIQNRVINHSGIKADKAVDTQDMWTEKEEESTVELSKLKKRLSNEKKLRDSLVHRLKKCKLENRVLLKEIEKLTKQEDHIFIDHETFTEIKCTFEKFKKVLDVMKEYGLWETITRLGINFDVAANPLDAVVSKTSTSDEGKNLRGKKSDSSSLHYSQRDETALSCRQLLNKFHSHNLRSNESNVKILGLSNPPSKSREKVEKSTPVGKTLVQQVFKEVRENYSNSSNSNHSSYPGVGIHHCVPLDFTADEPIRKQPDKVLMDYRVSNTTGRRPTYREILYSMVGDTEPTKIECTADSNIKQDNTQNVNTQMAILSPSHPKKQLIQKSSSESSELETQKPKRHSIRIGNVTNKPTASSSIHQEYSNEELDVSTDYKQVLDGKSLPEKSDSIPNSTSAKTRSSKTSRSNHPSGSSDTQSSLKSNDSLRLVQSSKVNTASLKRSSLSKPDGKSTKSFKSNSAQAKSKSNESSSASSHSSTYKAKSKLPLSSAGEHDASESYLESVSEASTDQDVRSLSKSEIFSLQESVGDSEESLEVRRSSKRDISEKETVIPRVEKTSDIVVNVGDSKEFNKVSKSSERDIVKETAVSSDKKNCDVGKEMEHVQKTAPAESDKKDNSDSSVPSLSDITTVSSRSLNTDSIMDKLSDD